MKLVHLIAGAFLPLLLPACALQTPPASVAGQIPLQWFTPMPTSQPVAGLPHTGTLTDLTQWWEQQGDPLLAALIAAAQAVSPTVASARSRVEQARATQVAAGAALLPALDASASASRGRLQQGGGPGAAPISTSSQAGLQASWEVDLFGGRLAGRDAASERLTGAQAQWHDARVSVAAEVANQYHSLRTCQQLETVTAADAASRRETARLSRLSTDAGFTAPATDALARASAAEASSRATQQRAQCEMDTKALVALTGLAEPDIRQKAAQAPSPPVQAAMIYIASLPTDTLAQRPDVFNAEREVAAASAEIGTAQAERYPRLSLSGAIGQSRVLANGLTSTLDTWSIGPLALTLPLFDGGRRAANVDAAVARYEEAAALYRARVRQAVREVEEALVKLQSTAARGEDARLAADGYRAAFTGTEARYKSGLGSLFELEDARRTLLSAETGLLSLQRERAFAWVALYRAAGGGWTAAHGGPAPASASVARP